MEVLSSDVPLIAASSSASHFDVDSWLDTQQWQEVFEQPRLPVSFLGGGQTVDYLWTGHSQPEFIAPATDDYWSWTMSPPTTSYGSFHDARSPEANCRHRRIEHDVNTVAEHEWLGARTEQSMSSPGTVSPSSSKEKDQTACNDSEKWRARQLTLERQRKSAKRFQRKRRLEQVALEELATELQRNHGQLVAEIVSLQEEAIRLKAEWSWHLKHRHETGETDGQYCSFSKPGGIRS